MAFYRQLKKNQISAVACIVFIFSGCAKAPDTELATAKAAIKAAQDVEADKYMAKNFKNVIKALETTEAEIALQNRSFFLSRKYTKAKQLLKQTTDLAIEIKNETPKAKEEMAATVKENLPIVRDMLKLTALNIKKAARFKDKHIIAGLNAELSSADSVTARAAVDFEAGKLLSASESLSNVQITIQKIMNIILNENSETVQFEAAEIQ
jgi:hypothetical protein